MSDHGEFCDCVSCRTTKTPPLVSHEERQHEATYGGMKVVVDPALAPGAAAFVQKKTDDASVYISIKEEWDRIEKLKDGPSKDNVVLPEAPGARKELPLATGLLDYFPAALAAVAALSKVGNEQHNPGQPMHWARSKSGDEADALVRHLLDRGHTDTDGIRHSTKVAWRALALLQKELEAAGEAPLARGARL